MHLIGQLRHGNTYRQYSWVPTYFEIQIIKNKSLMFNITYIFDILYNKDVI